MKKEIRITPIKNGTAIDHLMAGSAKKIIDVLDLEGLTVTAGMNVESRKMGKKDIMFIDGKELSGKEFDKVALIGKGATVNIIKNSEIARKFQLSYPESVEEVIKCINPKCITNYENIATKFFITKEPLEAKCFYCEERMNAQEIINSMKK